MLYCSRDIKKKFCCKDISSSSCPLAFTSLQYGTKWFVCFKNLHQLSWYDNQIESFFFQSWSVTSEIFQHRFLHEVHFSSFGTEFLRNLSKPAPLLQCDVQWHSSQMCEDCCLHCWVFCCCTFMLSHSHSASPCLTAFYPEFTDF